MPHDRTIFRLEKTPDQDRHIVGGVWMRRDGVERPFLVYTPFGPEYERFYKVGIQHGRVVDIGPGTGGFQAVDGSRRFLDTAPGAEFRDGSRSLRRMTDDEVRAIVQEHIPADGLVRAYEHGLVPHEPHWRTNTTCHSPEDGGPVGILAFRPRRFCRRATIVSFCPSP